MTKLSFLVFTILILPFGLIAQNWEDAKITTHQVTDKVYMLEGMGGNIGVFAGEDGVLMIDSQYAPLSDKILTAIREISDGPLSYLVNTHWHGDHVGGNENFANAGATIIAHYNVRERVSTEQIRPFRKPTPPSPEAAWPSITFEENMRVHINGERIYLFHIDNAHTDGDALIYFPVSNVMHMGDCMFNYRFPYVDLSSGGHPDGAIKAVEAALMISDENTTIIPGHGPVAKREDLLRYQEMWYTIRDRVKEAMEDGITQETADAKELTLGFEEWNWRFITDEKFVQMIFSAYAEE